MNDFSLMQILQYSVKLALEAAKLRGTEIEEFGINSNFANAFKKEYGVIPTQILGIKIFIESQLDGMLENI